MIPGQLKKRIASRVMVGLIGVCAASLISDSAIAAGTPADSQPNLVCDLRLVRMDKGSLQHNDAAGMTFGQADRIASTLRDVGAAPDDVESSLRAMGANWRTLADMQLLFMAGSAASGTFDSGTSHVGVVSQSLSIASSPIAGGAVTARIDATYLDRVRKNTTTLEFHRAAATMQLGVPVVLSPDPQPARKAAEDDVLLVATVRMAPGAPPPASAEPSSQ